MPIIPESKGFEPPLSWVERAQRVRLMLFKEGPLRDKLADLQKVFKEVIDTSPIYHTLAGSSELSDLTEKNQPEAARDVEIMAMLKELRAAQRTLLEEKLQQLIIEAEEQ